MKSLLEFLLSSITDSSAIEISVSEIDDIVRFEVSAPEEIKPHIIGKSGRTIKAIQTLLQASSRKEGKRVFVNILD